MVRVNVVVRDLGGLKPDYSLDFELPQVPEIGSYLSIQRPETGAAGSTPPKVGTFNEIFVECD